MDTVPVDVNFFDLGGHSLSMFKLQDALEQRCGLRPTIVSLFQETTVSAQAAPVVTRGRRQARPAPPKPPAERVRPDFANSAHAREPDSEHACLAPDRVRERSA
ncbi:phosphopantetheine-binding protein [Streptomyces sp. NPDC054864]